MWTESDDIAWMFIELARKAKATYPLLLERNLVDCSAWLTACSTCRDFTYNYIDSKES